MEHHHASEALKLGCWRNDTFSFPCDAWTLKLDQIAMDPRNSWTLKLDKIGMDPSGSGAPPALPKPQGREALLDDVEELEAGAVLYGGGPAEGCFCSGFRGVGAAPNDP